MCGWPATRSQRQASLLVPTSMVSVGNGNKSNTTAAVSNVPAIPISIESRSDHVGFGLLTHSSDTQTAIHSYAFCLAALFSSGGLWKNFAIVILIEHSGVCVFACVCACASAFIGYNQQFIVFHLCAFIFHLLQAIIRSMDGLIKS